MEQFEGFEKLKKIKKKNRMEWNERNNVFGKTILVIFDHSKLFENSLENGLKNSLENGLTLQLF